MDVRFPRQGKTVDQLRQQATALSMTAAQLAGRFANDWRRSHESAEDFRPELIVEDAGQGNDRNRLRCILVHGFNGEPIDMTELAGHLESLGFSTENLLLPGHGTSIQDFAEHGWQDWYAAVRGAVSEALDRGEGVLLIGHSMGASVCLAVTADEPRVQGIVAMCPPIELHPLTHSAVSQLGRILRYFPSWREDVRDRRGARARYPRRAYSWTAVSTLQSLLAALPDLKGKLGAIRCPALVICARNDHVVPMRDGLLAYQLVGSEDKELAVLRHSYHAVTKDVERHVVFDRVLRFCHRIHVTSPEHAEG